MATVQTLLRTRKEFTTNAAEHVEQPAFLIIAGGGTSHRALPTFCTRHQIDGEPLDTFILYVDTDPLACPLADETLHIGITPEQATAIKGDPGRYGPVSETVARHYPYLLEPESCRHGSRTVPMQTQVAVEVYLFDIITTLAKAIRQLHKQSGGKRIVVILTGSSGGGCGSALVCIIANLLNDLAFRSLVTEGLAPHVLSRPIALVVEPFAFAFDNGKLHADRILANAGAFRIQGSFLLQQHALAYLFSLGLSNNAGAVNDTKEAIAVTLGSSLYALARDYTFLKSRWVDTVDSNRNAPYLGRDIPEYLYPPSDHPPYAATVETAARMYPFTVTNNRLMAQYAKVQSNGDTQTL